MAKFGNEPQRVEGAVKSIAPGTTHEGGQGFVRDAKSELFLLAVTNMVGEQTFYEAASDRDAHFQALVHQVTAEDPEWIRGFVPYLRDTMQMRSASLVMAAEYAVAGGPKPRGVISSALKRADEPGEMLAYWKNRYGKLGGRTPSGGFSRGIADAVTRLYTQRAALRYDGHERGWRMGDVIELVHPQPSSAEQSALFEYLLTARHGHKEETSSDMLPTIKEDRWLHSLPVVQRREKIYQAGKTMSWERLSGWLEGQMDALAWTSAIPSMGYMALMRNLRNFEKAGVAPPVLQAVSMRLANEEEVAKSRQFPIRFFSAWKASQSMTFGAALERALTHSLQNVPSLPGRSLILVDTSGSMYSSMSDRSTVSRHELAGVFGAALAMRAESADLFAFGTGHERIPFEKTGSVLRIVERLPSLGGTETWPAIRATYHDHDRIILLTDEQAWYDANPRRPPGAKFYTFNLAGYKVGHAESGKDGAYTFGGLTDACFRMLPLLERGRDAGWPWQGISTSSSPSAMGEVK